MNYEVDNCAAALSTVDLEVSPVTIVQSEIQNQIGKVIAVDSAFICYAVRGSEVSPIAALCWLYLSKIVRWKDSNN